MPTAPDPGHGNTDDTPPADEPTPTAPADVGGVDAEEASPTSAVAAGRAEPADEPAHDEPAGDEPAEPTGDAPEPETVDTAPAEPAETPPAAESAETVVLYMLHVDDDRPGDDVRALRLRLPVTAAGAATPAEAVLILAGSLDAIGPPPGPGRIVGWAVEYGTPPTRTLATIGADSTAAGGDNPAVFAADTGDIRSPGPADMPVLDALRLLSAAAALHTSPPSPWITPRT